MARPKVWAEEATHVQLDGSTNALLTSAGVYLRRGGELFFVSERALDVLVKVKTGELTAGNAKPAGGR